MAALNGNAPPRPSRAPGTLPQGVDLELDFEGQGGLARNRPREGFTRRLSVLSFPERVRTKEAGNALEATGGAVAEWPQRSQDPFLEPWGRCWISEGGETPSLGENHHFFFPFQEV